MSITLRELLMLYRTLASNEREKGGYFERLVRVWLTHAPTQRDQFSRVITWQEFAVERGLKATDTGIDLVAQIVGEDDSWCAIQCKFYAEHHRIQKADIDSFFTASGKAPFARRMIVDSTVGEWGKNAAEAIADQAIPVTRIGLNDLEYSGIDWTAFSNSGGETVQLIDKKSPRAHQLEALRAVEEGLAEADRGKLIMACGTGKTYTGLIIAQALAGKGKRVLFLVPSLSLMSQTIREWSIDATVPLRSFAVCSDSQVGVKKAGNDDLSDIDATDLEIPATTWPAHLARRASPHDEGRMTVVFSTYQSLPAVAKAQADHGLPDFDLIICDEAHRTTGATLAGEDESNFVRVHDGGYIRGTKRLYMTATPRIFSDKVKKVADDNDATLVSMDDETLFGKTLFTRNFGWAVSNNLLTDYKVIVLAMDSQTVSEAVQNRLNEAGNKLKLDDATKMVGCYKALAKIDLQAELVGDTQPVKRALAFARSIDASRTFEAEFPQVAAEWRASLDHEVAANFPELVPEALHVDGTFNANRKSERLAWLKQETDDEICRILTNARCLTEGVDVPALDAVLFLHPRKSQIDVVQAVGRVMRRSEGKKMGYVILPVVIPPGMAPETALDRDDTFQVVWQVLNALRSHDERLDATINKIELGVDPGDRIQIVSPFAMMGTEVGAEVTTLPSRTPQRKKSVGIGEGSATDEDREALSVPSPPEQQSFVFDEFARAIMARIVKKCGTRAYVKTWAADVARIAGVHITRITAAVDNGGSEEQAAFGEFLEEIRDDLNEAITKDEAIEMLAQHMITRPVFEALFSGYPFSENNPVAIAIEKVLTVLDRQSLEKETKDLERFYENIRIRVSGIEDTEAKQTIIKNLYEDFFKKAFPKLTAKFGIVYTPVEIVDFIIKSVEEVLNEEFGQSISDEGVHVIDPFTGTGTFITRLLQSGLIRPEDMARKYAQEIHANEIVLLAYYIAAINIEAVFHDQTGTYEPFPGICLTDTFQMYEKDDLVSGMMAVNSDRRTRQKNQPIRVIFGNPPYSAKQESSNDNAANVKYPSLDARIAETYAAMGLATNKNALYDSYIRAIRWATDRLVPYGGVLAFVSSAGWLEGSTGSGMRLSIATEFNRIDIFHLRGDQYTKGEVSRREGGKIFAQGSRTPVAITVLTFNPIAGAKSRIRFHDIGDYLSREDKLARIANFASLAGISKSDGWQVVLPDEHGDWLKQRDDSFSNFYPLSAPIGASSLFAAQSRGLETGRDAWCYNDSKSELERNILRLLETYTSDVGKFFDLDSGSKMGAAYTEFDEKKLTTDPKKIKWSRGMKKAAARGDRLRFDASAVRVAVYSPFSKTWSYFGKTLSDYRSKISLIFPDDFIVNRVISIPSQASPGQFSSLMCERLPDTNLVPGVGGYQNFPRYIYTPAQPETPPDDLFATADAGSGAAGGYIRTDAITDAGLKHFTDAYPGEAISKDDVFDYVYGILHHPTYRERYADNLTKQLPRIPLMQTAEAFRAIVAAGGALGDLHVNYETVEAWPVTIAEGDLRLATIPDPVSYFRVEKMKFGGKRGAVDKTTIHYNPRITVTGVPLRAYDYVINGKSAIDWVMERQSIKPDKASGIISDANAWANETVGDPRYPLDLLCRVITVSMRTLEIVEGLPPFEIREG